MENYLKDGQIQRSDANNVPAAAGPSGREGLYPSYKSLDDFIDVDWLKSLHAFVTDRIVQRLSDERDLSFYTGPFLLDSSAPRLPGSRMVALSQSALPENYYDLDRTELWKPTAAAEEFAPLMEFIASLPFAETGRMMIMYDPSGRAVSAHRDHDSQELCHEFIWMRTNFAKPFYMLDPPTGEKLPVTSHSAWFDTVNQFHGADQAEGLSFSIRVDGRFSDAFRALVPWPETNRSSAPSLWARQGLAAAAA